MYQNLDYEAIDEFSRTVINSLDFTVKAENLFYDTVDLADFREKDAETIFQCLKNEIRLVPFGDYLKRYIYIKSGMTGDYDSVELREYQHTIIDSFAENYTPKSFSETTAKLSALTKNWLTQESVNRSTVFLLGFGLNMSVDDVSGFLTKALRERDFDFKNPLEILYWYCYSNGYKYPKMHALKAQFENSSETPDGAIYDNMTINLRNTVRAIKDDKTLLTYISKLKGFENRRHHSVAASRWFVALYSKCKDIIAEFYSKDERERESGLAWTVDDITEGDVEKVLCCGMPVNSSGNLEKMSASKLAKFFDNKRFSRQHIAELLSNSTTIDRFDLITLNFFIYSQADKYADDNKNRFIAFTDSTNEILTECLMGELYVANPYECFILMCILSDCPLATYADVWEMSYE